MACLRHKAQRKYRYQERKPDARSTSARRRARGPGPLLDRISAALSSKSETYTTCAGLRTAQTSVDIWHVSGSLGGDTVSELASEPFSDDPQAAAQGGAGRQAQPIPSSAGRSRQPMCRPPFSEKSAPVEKPDSSDASHDTIDPISSGRPRRRTGIVATIFSSTSGRIAFTISVPM
jgi:hypothetical protein